MARILILGGGFGGVTVATELAVAAGGTHEITVVDQHEQFLMGLRQPWAIAGAGSLAAGRRSRHRLAAQGVRFLEERITAIDPASRVVSTTERTLAADQLIVALGAEPRPELVPGFAGHAHNLYDPAAIPALRTAVERFTGGRIVIAVTGVPYKCPPAPYETLMLLHEHLAERGIRDACELHTVTPQPMLLPNAGADGSAWLAGQLDAREISYDVGAPIESIEAGHYLLDGSAHAFDLLIGVPPHRPPAVVRESGLVGSSGWVPVDPGTLRTRFAGVWAIGDVTGIQLANGLPLPKAGIIAELEGARVAAAIAAELAGDAAPEPFDGKGFCYIELGKTAAAMVQGDFFARPQPAIALRQPSPEHAEAKRRFERERLERWFTG